MSPHHLRIRPEDPAEHRVVEELVRDAFWDLYQPGCLEHYLVHHLRGQDAFRSDLSFVAEQDGRLVGVIFYANATIKKDQGTALPVLTFGPLAVLPRCQKQGIGKALIDHTVALAKTKGERAILIYGNPEYYHRHGFQAASNLGVTDSHGDCCDALQVLELHEGALAGHSGCFLEGEAYNITPDQAAAYETSFPSRKKHALPSQIFLGMGALRPIGADKAEDILEIINDAAMAYKGVIPDDRWHEPYMSMTELRQQIRDGVVFHGYVVNGLTVGVMGIQDKGEVNLIRHAYVRSACRKLGIGGKLLEHLTAASTKPLLVGTWGQAIWAISFYQKHGFKLVEDGNRKNDLLRRYWSIPERQVETSVVLTRPGQ